MKKIIITLTLLPLLFAIAGCTEQLDKKDYVTLEEPVIFIGDKTFNIRNVQVDVKRTDRDIMVILEDKQNNFFAYFCDTDADGIFQGNDCFGVCLRNIEFVYFDDFTISYITKPSGEELRKTLPPCDKVIASVEKAFLYWKLVSDKNSKIGKKSVFTVENHFELNTLNRFLEPK